MTTKQDSGEGSYADFVIEVSGNFVTIPILQPEQQITSDYIKALDKAINSDGCTGVKDYFRDCCVVHDLGYRYRIDPWGRFIERSQVDAGLRTCIQSKSKFGRFSPISWIRWAGVRIFGRFLYKPKN